MRFEHHPSLGSTNDRAMQIVRAWGADEGLEPVCVSADVQTNGRGRNGRQWASATGGAWFSVAWPWQGRLDQTAAAPLVAGLAVRQAALAIANEYTVLDPVQLEIKWPNDLLLDGRKLAGILCEQSLVSTNACTAGLVVGVGINVNQPIAGQDQNFRAPAISLCDKLGGLTFPLDSLIRRCADGIASNLQALSESGFSESFRTRIESVLAYRSQVVKLLSIAGSDSTQEVNQKLNQGVLQGIDPSGGLRVGNGSSTQVFHTGEIASLRPASPQQTNQSHRASTTR